MWRHWAKRGLSTPAPARRPPDTRLPAWCIPHRFRNHITPRHRHQARDRNPRGRSRPRTRSRNRHPAPCHPSPNPSPQAAEPTSSQACFAMTGRI
jgi:hypothetical protein